MLIKSKLDSNECEDASKILGTYINDINKYSHIMTTGNEVFDVFFTINTSNVKFELVKNISIPKKEFYNSIEFINFISGLLNHIQEDNVVHFAMEDKGYLCSISLSSTECFYVKKKLEEFLDKNKNNYISYDLSEDPYFYLLKIVMRIKDEKDLQVFNEYIKFK